MSSKKYSKTRNGDEVQEMENHGKRQDGRSDRSLIRRCLRMDLKNIESDPRKQKLQKVDGMAGVRVL